MEKIKKEVSGSPYDLNGIKTEELEYKKLCLEDLHHSIDIKEESCSEQLPARNPVEKNSGSNILECCIGVSESPYDLNGIKTDELEYKKLCLEDLHHSIDIKEESGSEQLPAKNPVEKNSSSNVLQCCIRVSESPYDSNYIKTDELVYKKLCLEDLHHSIDIKEESGSEQLPAENLPERNNGSNILESCIGVSESPYDSNYIKTEELEYEKLYLEDLHHSIDIKEESGLEQLPAKNLAEKNSGLNALECKISGFKGAKRFSCKICDYKCANKSNLNRHLRIHTGEKPYTCEICNSKFGYSGNLKTHLRTHPREKSFVCNLCSYTCADHTDFIRHFSTHTNEQSLLACHICDYKTKLKLQLEHHLNVHKEAFFL